MDKLTLYICNPAESKTELQETKSPTYRSPRARSPIQSADHISNKVEIDQDNIETPPATRRVFTPTPLDKREPVQPSPCRRLMGRSSRDSLASPDEPELNLSLGDGQFDRFSAARRTRRYKRNTENTEVTSPPELVAETQVIKPSVFNLETSSPVTVDSSLERETRLQAWKDRLKTQNDATNDYKSSNRRSRQLTGVNQDDVKKALSLNIASLEHQDKKKSVTTTYISPDSCRLENTSKIDIPNRKNREHDNDEGFEETQSLMSESPSQGASSGGNFETDLVDSSHLVAKDYSKSKPTRTTSFENKETVKSSCNDTRSMTKSNLKTKVVPKSSTPSSRAQALNQKMNRNFDRSSTLRQTTQEISKKSVIPRRSGSLRKVDSQNSANNKRSVQRSNSRNSIVSSRSSLNSATSTNTVKRNPLKPSNSNTGSSRIVQRTPSTKALSSITKANTSLKRTPSSGGTMAIQKPPRPSSSFMKPTTSSATKTAVIPSRIHSTNFRSKN